LALVLKDQQQEYIVGCYFGQYEKNNPPIKYKINAFYYALHHQQTFTKHSY